MTSEHTPTPIDPIERIRDRARELHSRVEYGSGQMIGQVLACATEARTIEDKALEIVALLHKSQEPRKVASGKEPLKDEEILKLVGDACSDPAESEAIIGALTYLKNEPNDKDEKYTDNKKLYDSDLNRWVSAAPPLAKGMLLIEKHRNFNESLSVLNLIGKGADLSDVGKTQRNPQWHLDYATTRKTIVEAANVEQYSGLYTVTMAAADMVVSFAGTVLGELALKKAQEDAKAAKEPEAAFSGGGEGWSGGRVSPSGRTSPDGAAATRERPGR